MSIHSDTHSRERLLEEPLESNGADNSLWKTWWAWRFETHWLITKVIPCLTFVKDFVLRIFLFFPLQTLLHILGVIFIWIIFLFFVKSQYKCPLHFMLQSAFIIIFCYFYRLDFIVLSFVPWFFYKAYHNDLNKKYKKRNKQTIFNMLITLLSHSFPTWSSYFKSYCPWIPRSNLSLT